MSFKVFLKKPLKVIHYVPGRTFPNRVGTRFELLHCFIISERFMQFLFFELITKKTWRSIFMQFLLYSERGNSNIKVTYESAIKTSLANHNLEALGHVRGCHHVFTTVNNYQIPYKDSKIKCAHNSTSYYCFPAIRLNFKDSGFDFILVRKLRCSTLKLYFFMFYVTIAFELSLPIAPINVGQSKWAYLCSKVTDCN